MSTAISAQPELLRIAIIGGGPGGLGSAIALSSLPNVEISLYEQARELREIGAGIRIGFNCWKVLELLGAADGVRGHGKTSILHRNGLTGELVKAQAPSTAPVRYIPRRVRRTRLQSALKAKVSKGIIQLNKRLMTLENIEEGSVRLVFEDGTETTADIVIGGDGIRSVVREKIFPGHTIKFTGTTIWRVLIPVTSVSNISEMVPSTTWWHGPNGHVYTSLVDDPSELPEDERMFEIAARNVIDPEMTIGKRFSWGIPATKGRVESHFMKYDLRVREVLQKVPEGQWKEFSAFAGPRLEKLTAWDKVVLIGDASHPLSGAFGSGAAFALEDGWILAKAIEHSRSSGRPIAYALSAFDSIRSPYYLRMYQHLDQQKKKVQAAKAADPNKSFESSLEARMGAFGEDKLDWVYGNNIEEVWSAFLDTSKKVNGHA